MARSIYSGAISFGLVTVPVSLYSATESHTISFHQLQKGTGNRVRQMRVVEGTKKEVDYEDVVKGYEVEDGQWIALTKEDRVPAVELRRALDRKRLLESSPTSHLQED